MSAPSSMLECALELARRGWPAFPCSPPYDSSPQRGKRPLCPHGFKDATTDEAALRTWWTRWPDANVGLATGSPSGLIVVDVDPRNGGLESLASLPEWKAHIEQTLCVRTGGGGFHAYFSCEK
ncbi:MAG: bifunctional DNA primase/polymerase, partial [Planctomycetes bacterium]|nr:bifunctional DNA primase/polymerase [Planctomycetota bacterium]